MEAAWAVFGFAASTVRAGDPKVRSRFVNIAFNPEGDLVVGYGIDDVVTATKSFARNNVTCDAQGLHVTITDHTGAVVNELPSHGRLVVRSTFHRSGDFLYVKEVVDTRARTFGVVPEYFLNVTWFRFPTRQP